MAVNSSEIVEVLQAEAKERQKEHGGTSPGNNTSGNRAGSVSGDSRDQVGEIYGVSADGELLMNRAK